MNTNLNNIPLEIYLDYCTETTGQEWTLDLFACIMYHPHFFHLTHNQTDDTTSQGGGYLNHGSGVNYGYANFTIFGTGILYTYIRNAYGCGNRIHQNIITGDGFGFAYASGLSHAIGHGYLMYGTNNNVAHGYGNNLVYF